MQCKLGSTHYPWITCVFCGPRLHIGQRGVMVWHQESHVRDIAHEKNRRGRCRVWPMRPTVTFVPSVCVGQLTGHIVRLHRYYTLDQHGKS